MDDSILHTELMDAAVLLAGRDAKRTPACPDEGVYWAVLEDQYDPASETVKHIVTCAYCLLQTSDIARTLSTPSVLTAGEQNLIHGLIDKRFPAAPRLIIQRIAQEIIAIQNPFQSAEVYRSPQKDAITISTKTKMGVFVIEFVTGADSGHIEILLRSQDLKKSDGLIEAEFWKDDQLVRSVPISKKKTALSQWPKGDYQLVLTANGTKLTEIEISFL